MNSLIIGTNFGMPYAKIEHWASSALKTGNNVLMILMGENDDVQKKLNKIGVETVIVPSKIKPHKSPNNERFFFQGEILKNRPEQYAIMTDTRDVIFQHDPIKFISEKNYEIICGSEGVRYRDEPWGIKNLRNGYPNEYRLYQNNPIMNVGVIGGLTESLSRLSYKIYEMTTTVTGDYHSDQSSFNILCHQKNSEFKILKCDADEPFVIHCGTMMTNLNGGAFKNERGENRLSKPGIIKNGIFKNHLGEDYLITHQWDRVTDYDPSY